MRGPERSGDWGILGSGFGLYGYLPALLAGGVPTVHLPERYRSTVLRRSELAPWFDRVRFVADDEALAARVGALVVAQRPQDAWARLDALLGHAGLRHLVVEKPLACEPAQSIALVERIEAAGKTCRGGFTFRWAPWADLWRRAMAPTNELASGAVWRVDWRFEAHHYRHDLTNWKRMPEQGGGALRFYGIHLIALLAEWGYEGVTDSSVSPDEQGGAERWQAVLIGRGLPPVQVNVDCRSPATHFRVHPPGGSAALLVDLLDPFAQPLSAGLPAGTDRRCDYLQALLAEDLPSGSAGHRRLRAANTLWAAVEARTSTIVCAGSAQFA